MASFLQSIFFSALLSILFTVSLAQQSFLPHALVLSVNREGATGQYLTQLNQRTPLVPIELVVDLGGVSLWADCDKGYVSSSYRPARCGSSQCLLARSTTCGTCIGSPSPSCSNNTCGLTTDNTVIGLATSGNLIADVLSLQSTDGSRAGRVVNIPNFLFTCGSTFLLKGLASGVVGMAGLGRSRIALPSQLAAVFSLRRKFAICIGSGGGVIFFGDGPYKMLPNVDVTDPLFTTPLLINPVSTASAYSPGEPSAEYFIGVKSIKINGKRIPLNTSLLSINDKGYGGTKISTVNPYTVLETSIYNAVTDGFIKEATAMKMTRVADSFGPFKACYRTHNVASTRLGPTVPIIDLVLQQESVYWRIVGANSMVYINEEVFCLGVVNGGSGKKVRTSIVIGGYQLHDIFLQFDLEASRLGFSSSLLGKKTGCYNFDFTSNA